MKSHCITVLALVGLSKCASLVTASDAVPKHQQHGQRLRRTASTNTYTKTRSTGNIETRIIGGSIVKNPYPFFALLEVGCGATLIHDDILLSAGHCDIGNIFTRKTWIGGVELDSGLVRDVTRTIRHPQYDDVTIDYDFLILKLNTTALYDPYFQLGQGSSITSSSVNSAASTATTSTTKQSGSVSVTIPPSAQVNGAANSNSSSSASSSTSNNLLRTGLTPIPINRDPAIPAEGQGLTIMGFGLTDPNGFGLVENLHENVVYAVVDDRCAAAYDHMGFASNVMMCAGHPQGGADTCQGDSGGPMIDKESNTLVGVTSWGEGCGEGAFPGVYAQVNVVADWIDQEICKNSCYPPSTCDPTLLHPCATAGATPESPVQLSGPVDLILKVTFDTYPSEFGAILVHYPTDQELLYIPYDTWQDADSTVGEPMMIEKTVDNLPAGIYHLMIGDRAGDGLCCAYGEGSVIVTNAAGDVLWDAGQYSDYTEAYMNISSTGDLVWVANNPDGIVTGSWPDDDGGFGGFFNTTDDFGLPVDFDPSVDDELWPGDFPSPVGTTNVLTINIRTDGFPEETLYVWSQRTGPETFDDLDTMAPMDTDSLFSFTQTLENESVYRLTITDELGDGSCCFYGTGWVTINNATASFNSTEGTVMWSLTGDDIDAQAEAFVWVDAMGRAQMAEYLPGQGYAVIVYELVTGERSHQVVVPESEKPSASTTKQNSDLFT